MVRSVHLHLAVEAMGVLLTMSISPGRTDRSGTRPHGELAPRARSRRCLWCSASVALAGIEDRSRSITNYLAKLINVFEIHVVDRSSLRQLPVDATLCERRPQTKLRE